MKIKNTAKYIIYAAGEAILPGKTSENEIESCDAISALVAMGHVAIVETEKPEVKADDTESPAEDSTTAAIKKVKAMRSLEKLRELADSVGITPAEDDGVEEIKQSLISYYENQ